MFTSDQTQQLHELVSPAQSALVIVPSQPTLDQVASAVALTASLEASGKQVSLISPQPLGAEFASILGIDTIQHQLGNRDLAVSFEYRPEAVDKVSYHIDEQQQRFYLVIKPQKGQKPLDKNTVEFSYTGAEADVIFLIGVHEFESLEHIYFGYEQLFQTAMTVTFHTFEPQIGTFKLDASGTSSLSESMSLLLQSLNWPIPAEAATNLLQAVEQATDGFQSLATSAETFETVAWLMRNGARRVRRPMVRPAPPVSVADPFANALRPTSGSVTPVSPITPQALVQTRPEKKNDRRDRNRHKGRPPGGKRPDKTTDETVGSLKYQPSGFGPGGNG